MRHTSDRVCCRRPEASLHMAHTSAISGGRSPPLLGPHQHGCLLLHGQPYVAMPLTVLPPPDTVTHIGSQPTKCLLPTRLHSVLLFVHVGGTMRAAGVLHGGQSNAHQSVCWRALFQHPHGMDRILHMQHPACAGRCGGGPSACAAEQAASEDCCGLVKSLPSPAHCCRHVTAHSRWQQQHSRLKQVPAQHLLLRSAHTPMHRHQRSPSQDQAAQRSHEYRCSSLGQRATIPPAAPTCGCQAIGPGENCTQAVPKKAKALAAYMG